MGASERLVSWSAHVTAVSRFEGTTKKSFEEQGINREALRYWQTKLGTQELSKPLASKALETMSSFAAVEVAMPERSRESKYVSSARLPNARWLAELIMQLANPYESGPGSR